ncbi:Gfo/Idh/MocA family protein [Paenibacillus koleovorans]|uniref:Gfo/Idh/MocA family protein n=1 Tax=Paenibacillus koleovorans TaxID=121608 RepID=UPI000FD741F1|nr:Gfo/Idh/MocA family oxidoreductase [Paenibacillus koleovorans]
MSKTWGIGMIGCGTIADFHMKALSEIDNAKVVAVSSRSEEKARSVAEAQGCAWYTDYKAMLADPAVDIVSVTTSSGSHYSIGMDVLRAGKHLVVEKPAAMKSADVAELIRTAQDCGVTLSVISQRRFEAQHQAVKQVIEGGDLGRLLLVEISLPWYRTQAYYDSADWRGTLAEDGGALMNQGIHSIDLLLWFGGELSTVFGKVATQTHEMEAEDLGLAIVQFKNGAFGTIMASTSIQPGFQAYLNLYGEKGTIKLEGTSITHWTVPGVEQPAFDTPTVGGGGVADPKAISFVNHKLQFIDVIRSIETGQPPLVTGADGYRAVQLVESIYASSAKGSQIVLEE